MKTNYIRIFSLFFILVIYLTSCTSLSKIKFADNPDFMKAADKYEILHPLISPSTETIFSKTAKTQIFTIEDVHTKNVYPIKVQWLKETNSIGHIENYNRRTKAFNILDIFFGGDEYPKRYTSTRDMAKGDVAKIRDIVLHQIDIQNPFDNKFYEVVGQVNFFRTIEKETKKTTFETTNISFPIEFWIYENGKEVGKSEINRPSLSSLALKINITINDKLLNLEYQEQFNKRKVSLEKDGELVAFFDLKPAAFISTKKKGNAFIAPGLSNDFIADIFASYIISDAMVGALKN